MSEHISSIENFIALSNLVIKGNSNALFVYGSGDAGKMYVLKELLGDKRCFERIDNILIEPSYSFDENSPYFGTEAILDFYDQYKILTNNMQYIKAEKIAKDVSIANGVNKQDLIGNYKPYDYIIVSNLKSAEDIKKVLYENNRRLVIIHNSDEIINQHDSKCIIECAANNVDILYNAINFKFRGRLIIVTNLPSSLLSIKNVNITMSKSDILQQANRILISYAIGVSAHARERTIALFNKLSDSIPIVDFTITNIIKMALVYDKLSNDSRNITIWENKVKHFLGIKL